MCWLVGSVAVHSSHIHVSSRTDSQCHQASKQASNSSFKSKDSKDSTKDSKIPDSFRACSFRLISFFLPSFFLPSYPGIPFVCSFLPSFLPSFVLPSFVPSFVPSLGLLSSPPCVVGLIDDASSSVAPGSRETQGPNSGFLTFELFVLPTTHSQRRHAVSAASAASAAVMDR